MTRQIAFLDPFRYPADMPTIIERAFQLARGGACRSVDDIRRKLKAEGYDSVESHLSGATIKRQLINEMKLPS